MRTVIKGILRHETGRGIDGGEFGLRIKHRTIIFANSGLQGWLKEAIGKTVTIIIDEESIGEEESIDELCDRLAKNEGERDFTIKYV